VPMQNIRRPAALSVLLAFFVSAVVVITVRQRDRYWTYCDWGEGVVPKACKLLAKFSDVHGSFAKNVSISGPAPKIDMLLSRVDLHDQIGSKGNRCARYCCLWPEQYRNFHVWRLGIAPQIMEAKVVWKRIRSPLRTNMNPQVSGRSSSTIFPYRGETPAKYLSIYVLNFHGLKPIQENKSTLHVYKRLFVGDIRAMSEQQASYSDDSQQNSATSDYPFSEGIGHVLIVLAFVCVPVGFLIFLRYPGWTWKTIIGLIICCLSVPLVLLGAMLSS